MTGKEKVMSGASKKSAERFEALSGQIKELEKHEVAMRAFDALPVKPLPKTAQLLEEFTALINKKKACYSEYRAAKKEKIEYQNARQNVDRFLGIIHLQKKSKGKAEDEFNVYAYVILQKKS